MKTFAVLTVSIFILSMSGCDETKKVVDAAGSVQLSGAYTVSSINEKAISSNAPTITFNAMDNTVNGNTGCNSFFGKYSLDLYALKFSEIASTEMACDEPIMGNENQFLMALRNTGSYSLENGILILYSANNRSVLLRARKEKNNTN